MILLYTALIFLLVTAKFLVDRRVKALEKKYIRVATEADTLVKQPAYKDGNSNRLDPYLTAKRQYQLGLLAQKRDRAEAKYTAWQVFAGKLGRGLDNVRRWKGKKLPYTFGAVDVAGLFSLADYLGVGDHVSVRALIQLVTSLFTR